MRARDPRSSGRPPREVLSGFAVLPVGFRCAPRWLAVLALASASCVGFVPPVEDTVSFGSTNAGLLRRGVALPDQGEGYVRARPGEPTRFGTPQLVSLLQRAAASVARTFPGTAPLRIGDLSSPMGGRHPRHGSHRTGRDADVIFYATDLSGRSVRGRGWLGYDRFGLARESRVPGSGAPSGEVFAFDDARNWHFVRTLVLDEEARVQWIFCSTGVKSRLLRYAARHEPSPEAIFRAAWMLHEPSRAARHDDHFHVRIACTPEQTLLGCQDRAPLWPWIRKGIEKPAIGTRLALPEDALVRALLSEDGSPETELAVAEPASSR